MIETSEEVETIISICWYLQVIVLHSTVILTECSIVMGSFDHCSLLHMRCVSRSLYILSSMGAGL